MELGSSVDAAFVHAEDNAAQEWRRPWKRMRLVSLRKRWKALLRLCSVQGNLLVMPIHDGFRDNMLDLDLLILEIDGVPFEAYDLLSAEAVVESHHHGKLKLSPPHLVKEFLYLIKIVEMREEGFLFGFLGYVRNVS